MVHSAHAAVTRGSAWTIALSTLWIVVAAACVAQTLERTGLAGPPWFGWWDAIVTPTGQPFEVQYSDLHAGGASAMAEVQNGDRVDLRALDFDTRVRVLWQPLATRPTVVPIHRGNRTFNASVLGSTLQQGNASRRVLHFLGLAPSIGFLACALLIILRRSRTFEGRVLAAYLLCVVAAQTIAPSAFVVPDARVNVVLTFLAELLAFSALVIFVHLSSRFGVRSIWRRAIEWIAYIANAVSLSGALAACVGVWTMWFDPVPFVMGTFWAVLKVAVASVVAISAVAAVVTSTSAEKPRAGWLLLPLALSLALSARMDATVGVQSWAWLEGIIVTTGAISLASAALVTYALLKRRVLDVGFVMSRSITVAILSLIVVAAFILLEYFLGSILTNVSHATGIAANAALALALGFSVHFIHKRVDAIVDVVIFRNRYENARALSHFSKEAAFVTDPEALVDLAIAKVRKHTDARSAGLFFRENGHYRATRSFNEVPVTVSENDPAVLALKTWHRPLDPHNYDTVLRGDLALPMVARGQLLGLLLCGERTGSEAYAPDEIEALAQFAQGIGSAYDYFAYAAPART